MDTIYINQNDPNYPSALDKYLGKDAPDTITAIGNLDIQQLFFARQNVLAI
jgi:hypothetical protein